MYRIDLVLCLRYLETSTVIECMVPELCVPPCARKYRVLRVLGVRAGWKQILVRRVCGTESQSQCLAIPVSWLPEVLYIPVYEDSWSPAVGLPPLE